MPTHIYSKEDFIKFLQKEVKDNQRIVFTNELTGNMSISKKSGLKLTHQYAHDVFDDVEVGHIAFGETHAIGLLVTEEYRLSEKAKSVLNTPSPDDK